MVKLRLIMKIVQLGDIAGVAYKLTEILLKGGNDARLLVCEPEKGRYFSLQLQDRVDRIIYRGFQSNLKILPKLFWNHWNSDLFHGHSMMNILLMFTGKPYVAHFHGSDVREVSRASTLAGFFLRRSMLRARHVLYCTKDLEADLNRIGVEARKRTWLPNPINLQVFRKTTSVDLPCKFKTVIFHPQRVQPVRRNDLFFRAFARIAPDYSEVGVLWVDHPSSGEHHQQMERLIRELGIRDRCELIPRIEPDRMVGFFNAVDIVADFFNREIPAVSQTILEAMCCEKPVIAAIPDDTSNYLHGSPVLAGGSVEEIEGSLRFLLERRECWPQLGRNGRKWVSRFHSFEVVQKRLEEVYRMALQKP